MSTCLLIWVMYLDIFTTATCVLSCFVVWIASATLAQNGQQSIMGCCQWAISNQIDTDQKKKFNMTRFSEYTIGSTMVDSLASILTIVFISVLPWLILAVMQAFKYVSKELFQSSWPKWYDGFIFYSPLS